MPPKRKASTIESNSDHEHDTASKPEAKKFKGKGAQESPDTTGKAANGQPTNKVPPVHISFPARAEGTLRLVTWNICGLAAAQKKGFKYYVEAEDPDILVLTETKVNSDPQDGTLNSRFGYRTWAISDKKSYSGTAALSKYKPLSVSTDLPGHPDPSLVNGRIITLEFQGCYVLATYVTNAGQGLKTLSEKNTWNRHFTTYIRDLDKKKPVIWMGDLNVAPTAQDLANPKPNWNKTPGYTKDETEAFKHILDPPECEEKSGKFVDIWRQRHSDDRHYTYFSYRFNCRAKGIGWRLDMFVVSERIAEKVKMCEIRSEIYGVSDHVPVIMEIESDVITGMS
ncbi:Endonuclease/exonuclease/phosphatase [Pisolithus thermaeus]|nr:Endonuclease/exonuclease/phosphatase [Pisolithus thermaeus]